MNSSLEVRKLWVLLMAAFVDMIGYAMVFPLLPFYAVRLGGSAQVIGLMVASFSIAQVAASPLWGRFSDKWGRRPGLLIGLAGSSVAFLIFGFADSLWLLFVSRFAQGASGGTTGIMQAYIGDSVPPEDRAKALGWLSAATSAGVMVGPAIGSLSNSRLGPEAGGRAYREMVGDDIDRHVAAIEMDGGAESPIGFGFGLEGVASDDTSDPTYELAFEKLQQIGAS